MHAGSAKAGTIGQIRTLRTESPYDYSQADDNEYVG
jgi:hypothetical protein